MAVGSGGGAAVDAVHEHHGSLRNEGRGRGATRRCSRQPATGLRAIRASVLSCRVTLNQGHSRHACVCVFLVLSDGDLCVEFGEAPSTQMAVGRRWTGAPRCGGELRRGFTVCITVRVCGCGWVRVSSAVHSPHRLPHPRTRCHTHTPSERCRRTCSCTSYETPSSPLSCEDAQPPLPLCAPDCFTSRDKLCAREGLSR